MSDHRTCRNYKLLMLLASAVLALALPVYAQLESGTFTGIVEDPTGAMIPDATVTVTNEGTNRSQTFTTGSSGLYRFVNVRPGLYTLRAEAKGFKAAVNRGIEITVGATQRVDFKMESVRRPRRSRWRRRRRW